MSDHFEKAKSDNQEADLMPDPTITRVCDGWDVDVDGTVMHLTSKPDEKQIPEIATTADMKSDLGVKVDA